MSAFMLRGGRKRTLLLTEKEVGLGGTVHASVHVKGGEKNDGAVVVHEEEVGGFLHVSVHVKGVRKRVPLLSMVEKSWMDLSASVFLFLLLLFFVCFFE